MGASIGPAQPSEPTFNPVSYPTLTHLQKRNRRTRTEAKLKLKLKPFPSQKHVSAKQFSNYPPQLQLPIHPRRQNFGEFFTTKTPISESISMRPLLQYLRISCRTNISHVTASLAFFQRGFHSAPPVTVIVTMSTTTRPT